jgi:hypothetical protein
MVLAAVAAVQVPACTGRSLPSCAPAGRVPVAADGVETAWCWLLLLLLCRFLLALVDPSPAVRQLAEYLLRDVLAVKAPLLAYNHFVEAIFVLNGCTAGLHGARLGANMGSHRGGASAATSLGQSAEDGGQEGAAGDVLGVAAPAQFTLKGKEHRCVAQHGFLPPATQSGSVVHRAALGPTRQEAVFR